MSDSTVRLTLEQHLGRLSQQAEALRGQLVPVQQMLPAGVLARLRQLSGTLALLQDSVKEHERERRNMRALSELSGVINSSLDVGVVLNEVLDTLIRLTGAGRAFLMLRGDGTEMEIVVARNWEGQTLEGEAHQFSRTIVQRVQQTGESILTTNAQADPRFGKQDSIVAYNLRSILCVPLKVKGQLTGVIYADNKIKEGLFTERERSLLSAFANQAAVALENARLFDSVKRSLEEVTELKTLMEDVFASIASGVLTADIHNRVTLANQAAARILARDRQALIGTLLDDLLGELDPVLGERVQQVKQADERYLGEEIQAEIQGRGPVQLRFNMTPLKTADNSTRGVAIVMDDVTEKRSLEAHRRLFSRMVSPAVIDQLDPDSIHLGGQRTEITTVFADIRGYTAFSQTTSPEALVSVLNRYLSVAADALLAEGGTIDKFLGDAVMAWFNAPLPLADHTLCALRAALAIERAVAGVHQHLPPDLHLTFGVGIDVGDALLGLVGTNQRVDYTAVGESVNIAKRLQEHAAAGQILVSAQVAAKVGNRAVVHAVPAIDAEGITGPLPAFELLGLR
ncbi:MAG: adenylate/guanylate cyclase domain-containing protein [Anaerolineales bacterium]